MYKRILICTDGSELATKAVDSGIALAGSLKADVVFFTSVEHYPQTYFEGAIATQMAEAARIEKEWLTTARARLDALVAQAAKAGVKATSASSQGAAAEGIIQAAADNLCDLIVMASHGRKGVTRVLLGSETTTVLTHSQIPVLVLR
jgi:nucleotide-binding universal stress UspA family protein